MRCVGGVGFQRRHERKIGDVEGVEQAAVASKGSKELADGCQTTLLECRQGGGILGLIDIIPQFVYVVVSWKF